MDHDSAVTSAELLECVKVAPKGWMMMVLGTWISRNKVWAYKWAGGPMDVENEVCVGSHQQAGGPQMHKYSMRGDFPS